MLVIFLPCKRCEQDALTKTNIRNIWRCLACWHADEIVTDHPPQVTQSPLPDILKGLQQKRR